MQAALAVLKLFELHQQAPESSTGLEPQAVYWMLKGGGGKVLQQHVDSAIQFLANPVVGVLEKKGGGFVLSLPAAKASVRIQSAGRALAAGNTPTDLPAFAIA